MSANDIVTPSWRTASIGDAADASPMELAELGEYVDLCKLSHGPVFDFYCFAETMMGFVATRFVTTLVLIVLLIAGCSLVL